MTDSSREDRFWLHENDIIFRSARHRLWGHKQLLVSVTFHTSKNHAYFKQVYIPPLTTKNQVTKFSSANFSKNFKSKL